MTSGYGQSSPVEWFAEAFHDVYTKGADAKPTSIAIVKEYEKRQTANQKRNFQKKERGWFTRLKRWFSKKVNFGRTHEAVQANPMDPMQVPAHPNNVAPMPQIPPAAAPLQNAVPNPGAGAGELQHYADNKIPIIRNHDPLDLAGDNELNKSLIVEVPKRKKRKKKKRN